MIIIVDMLIGRMLKDKWAHKRSIDILYYRRDELIEKVKILE